jgi:S-adenosylmethionine/arginine decarboxylase-like enzyme
MPGKGAPSAQAESWQPQAQPPKVLYVLDAALTPLSPVADIAQLTAYATAAVQAGHGNVLDASHVIFPNGAITLVLIWPEEDLIAVDLFSCGSIDGPKVISELIRLLRLADVSVRQLARGAQADRG